MGIRTNKPFLTFAGGENGPLISARTDLPANQTGYKKGFNFIPHIQGPARYREGTRFVRETSDIAILRPFVFSDSQSYILEFTHRRVRVFDDNGLVYDPSGVGPITNAVDHPTEINTTQITLNTHGLDDWSEVFIENVLPPTGGSGGIPELNGQWTVRVEDANTFRIQRKYTGGWVFAASANSKVKRIASAITPYRAYDDGAPDETEPTDADGIDFLEKATPSAFGQFESPEFLEIQTAQAFDVMYIAHKNCEPRKLTRTSAYVWEITDYSRTADPFSSTSLYPAAVAFYEQRLFWGGLTNSPQKIWYSKAADFDNYTAGSNAVDAGSYTSSTKQLSSIRCLRGTEQFLFVGGSDGALRMSGGGGPDTPITPTSVQMKEIDNCGVAKAEPVSIDKSLLYIQKDLQRLRSAEFQSASDGYRPVDLTKVSDEILRGRANQMAFQEGKPSVLWIQCLDGTLIGLNVDSAESIVGWHRHRTRSGDQFVSVAVRPVDRGLNEAWFIVRRWIDGAWVNFIEVMDLPREYPRREDFYTSDKAADEADYRQAMFDAQKYGYHLDCGLSYDGADNEQTLELASIAIGTGVNLVPSSTFFVSGDVGRIITQKNGPGRAVITGYTSGVLVAAQILAAFEIDLDENGDYILDAGDWFITATTLSGLDHLEGETVHVVADGAYLGEMEVEDGEIELDSAATVVHAGLHYRGLLKSSNIDSGGMNGPAGNKKKIVNKVVINFLDTLGAKYGTDEYEGQQIDYRNTADTIGRPPPLFTGPLEGAVLDVSDHTKHICIVQDTPLPCTVLSIDPSIETEND